jgi:hypothetical protein
VITAKKETATTTNGENTYYDEQFIVLDIYPKTNGTVNVTYGDLTKTITDTSGAATPEPQSVFFGTLYGVTDDIETPESGTVTIEGDYRGFGNGAVTNDKSVIVYPGCIIGVDSFGDVEFVPDYGFNSCDRGVIITIPTSVRYIGASAFYSSDASIPRTVVMLSALPPCLGSAAFNISDSDTFIVPSGCGDVYKGAEGWVLFPTSIIEAEV